MKLSGKPQDTPPAQAPAGDPSASAPIPEVAEILPFPLSYNLPLENLQIAIGGLFDVLADKIGPDMRLTVKEAKHLGEVWKPVLDYYGKRIADKIWFPAAASSLLILLPKGVKAYAEFRRRRETNRSDSREVRDGENNGSKAANAEPASSDSVRPFGSSISGPSS